jgi:hypothetical protein
MSSVVFLKKAPSFFPPLSLRDFYRHTERWAVLFVVLRACADLRKATISFVMADFLSVRMEQLGSHWTDFYEI